MHHYSLSTKSSQMERPQSSMFRIKSTKMAKSQLLSSCPAQEDLAYQNLQLKQQLNQLHQELNQYKIKLFQIEKDRTPNKSGDEKLHIIQGLKKQMKYYESEIMAKLKEIDELKKQSRISQYAELEAQLHYFQEECIRYKRLYEQEQSFKSFTKDLDMVQQDYQQMVLQASLNKLYEDNYGLIKEVASLRESNITLQQTVERQESQLMLVEKELKKARKLLVQSSSESQSQTSQPKTRQQIYKEAKERAELFIRIEQLDAELLKVNQEKDRQIEALISELTTLRKLIDEQYEKVSATLTDQQQHSFGEDNSVEQKMKNSRMRESKTSQGGDQVQRLSIVVAGANRILKRRSMMTEQASKTILEPSKVEEVIEVRVPDKLNDLTVVPKRMPRVSLFEVEQLGMQLKYELQRKQIKMQEIDERLSEKEVISIRELIDVFNQEPFALKDFESRKLLSRYLVEDNIDEYVLYDPSQVSNTQIVRSILRQLLGRYQLFEEKEIETLENQLSDIFSRISLTLKDAIQQTVGKKRSLKSGTCEKGDFELGLRFCDQYLSGRQMEYLLYLNYQQWKETHVIYYESLVNYFFNNI